MSRHCFTLPLAFSLTLDKNCSTGSIMLSLARSTLYSVLAKSCRCKHDSTSASIARLYKLRLQPSLTLPKTAATRAFSRFRRKWRGEACDDAARRRRLAARESGESFMATTG